MVGNHLLEKAGVLTEINEGGKDCSRDFLVELK